MSTVPTWGYRPDGEARIFDLLPGERLPEGWESSPACIVDSAAATAEALSARATGRPYIAPAADPVSGFRLDDEPAAVDPDALANALIEIDRLKAIIATGMAENEDLRAEYDRKDAEITRLFDLLDRYGTEREAAKAGLDAAKSDVARLTEALATAQADGGFSVAERDALSATVASLSEELGKAHTDLDALTAPEPAPAASAKTSKAR